MSDIHDGVEQELAAFAQTEGVTPEMLRQKAKDLLNGSMSGFPLILEHPKYGKSMRIQLNSTQDENVWVPVPDSWK